MPGAPETPIGGERLLDVAAGTRVAEALRAAASVLADAGIERAPIEAEMLLGHALGVRRVHLMAHPERVLAASEASAFAGLVCRRAGRYPLPYLTGEREFMGLRFLVNESVLIPRPETETLVEEAIAALRQQRRAGEPDAEKPLLAVDVGTGSGAIAIALASFLPGLHVVATDISPEACAVARENARRLGVAERVCVVEGDLLSPLEVVCGPGRPPAERAAAVCANLPYIPDEHLGDLQPEVRDWEPRLALAGGPGGLSVLERFLAMAPGYLRPGGRLLCEVGPEMRQPERVTGLLAGQGCWEHVQVLPDLAGQPRVVSAVLCLGPRADASGAPGEAPLGGEAR